ncbi:MAG: hypothetical protein CVU47_01400 [Chloroflexi bacterium HGW-Chloroflexi-9]|nr:MAG: hypothetical protein CVU47_01400 [Chloroflexi bacterium HGW-Chloroflexi-9]
MSDHTRRRLSSRSLSLVAATAVLGLAITGFLLMRALSGDEAATVATATSEPLLVFAEFGENADRLYLAPPERPQERTLIETIEHAPGWGINPAAGTARSIVAYTVLAPGVVPERDTPAELWVIDLATRERTRIARDADLLVAPTFADDGAVLVYRRSAGSQQELVRVAIQDNTRSVVHAEQTAFGIFPIGYTAGGDLLFARLSTAGTDVFSVRDGAAATLLFHASDQIARDWRLAPDGSAVSYLAPEARGERIVHRAHVVGVDGEERGLPDRGSPTGEQYGPTWTPDGRSLTVGQEAETGDTAPATVLGLAGDDPVALAPPEQGFDVPVQWSPDGRYLAARTFSGVNSMDAGTESAVIIGTDGNRYPVTAATEVILIGWYVHA